MTWHKVVRPYLWNARIIIIMKVNRPQDVRQFHIEDGRRRYNIVHPGSGLLLVSQVQ